MKKTNKVNITAAVLLVVAFMAFGCASARIPAPASIYDSLLRAQAAYNLADQGVIQFGKFAKAGMLTCATNPDGTLCKSGIEMGRIYTSTLQPATVVAFNALNAATDAAQIYSHLQNPTPADYAVIVEKIGSIWAEIGKISALLATENAKPQALTFEDVPALLAHSVVYGGAL